jgi:HD superfamily phosphohydrolase
LNKKKLFNDPVYGFITIHSDLIFDIIEEPLFQRLRRIKQLGLTDFVYPGALHTRFHHALGAMHLMGVTLNTLRSKGHVISDKEFESALIAVLLHDVGHGPFSHALEASILTGVHHERLSYLFMQNLNRKFSGMLDMTLQMFNNTYPRPFFHQLVSSQLDIDRLDYLQRDCYFTGVSEGTIGADRIIKMLDIIDEKIVVEEKGIYSIESFLSARRFMYWQVYLHKTTISAEEMLIQVIRRARYLALKGEAIFASPALLRFIKESVSLENFECDETCLEAFASIDDYDVWGAIKIWVNHKDKVLSNISRMLLDRKIFKVILSGEKPQKSFVRQIEKQLIQQYNLTREELNYFLIEGSTTNEAYMAGGQNIHVLTKKGKIIDIAQASDLPNIKAMSKIVRKYYVCWPKNLLSN